MQVTIGVSNRHVHLNEEDFKILFGRNRELTVVRDLVQPGQFASAECVDIKTEKGIIERVRIIGPIRPYTQIEISKSDAIKLKINPPIRDSGNLENSAPITIIGPNGTVDKTSGCIIANRHIHITPDMQKEFGLENISEVDVKLGGEKGGILSRVYLKVHPISELEFHIDTDDANGFLAKTGDTAIIMVNKNDF